jgi:hypothetical protein
MELPDSHVPWIENRLELVPDPLGLIREVLKHAEHVEL